LERYQNPDYSSSSKRNGEGERPLSALPGGAAAVEYFTLPGLAPGLVIKHITGKNVILPRKAKDWTIQDTQGFLESSVLSNRNTTKIVTTVKLLKSDVKVRQRTANSKANGKWIGGVRKTIEEFSRGSCSRMTETARNVDSLVTMFTFTYPLDFPCDGRVVKEHLSKLRKWLTYRGLGAFWFLEFQRRGAPHFHMFATGEVEKEALSLAWYKIVGSEDEKHLRAGTKVERIKKPHAIAAYAAKYAAKVEQKTVPEGYEGVGRFWGTFGGVKVIPVDEEKGSTWEMAPLVRVVRKLEKVNRQRMHFPVKAHKGKVGFTSYGTSPAIQKYLQWQRNLVHWERYVEIPF
jgi:hypothetical protein